MLPNGEAPIQLRFGGDSFIVAGQTPVNAIGLDRFGISRFIDISKKSASALAASDAAAREDSTDIDWAAYSEDISLYAINNEGVQLPEDQRLDEFAMLKRLMDGTTGSARMTSNQEALGGTFTAKVSTRSKTRPD